MTPGMILLAVALVFLAYAILIYNRLITFKNHFMNAFSQIDVQLQRRYELIPNLVETASAYLRHESETLVAVTNARNAAADRCRAAAKNPQDASLVNALAQAESTLSSSLGKLSVVMESYPELKADERMRDLHDELTSTENRVSFSRQAYSDAVMEYNTAREQFPAVVIAGVFSFREADLFEVKSPEMQERISVSFA